MHLAIAAFSLLPGINRTRQPQKDTANKNRWEGLAANLKENY